MALKSKPWLCLLQLKVSFLNVNLFFVIYFQNFTFSKKYLSSVKFDFSIIVSFADRIFTIDTMAMLRFTLCMKWIAFKKKLNKASQNLTEQIKLGSLKNFKNCYSINNLDLRASFTEFMGICLSEKKINSK